VRCHHAIQYINATQTGRSAFRSVPDARPLTIYCDLQAAPTQATTLAIPRTRRRQPLTARSRTPAPGCRATTLSTTWCVGKAASAQQQCAGLSRRVFSSERHSALYATSPAQPFSSILMRVLLCADGVHAGRLSHAVHGTAGEAHEGYLGSAAQWQVRASGLGKRGGAASA